MGKFKNIEIEIKNSTEKPLNIQRVIYREFFKILDKKQIEEIISEARGNSKVAMNLAKGDIHEP